MKLYRGPSLRVGCALSAIALLAACGGGSGGGQVGTTPPPPPAPPPAPPPSPPPPPPPPPPPSSPTTQPPPQGAVPTQFNTAEFRNSDGPDFHNAEYAWQLGFTGKDATLAVIDDGIDLDTGEFTGRLHPDSRDVHLNRSVEGEGYHGTHVAFIAAAARNNEKIVGIAPDATVLALRGELPGNCSVGNVLLDAGCGIPSSSHAAAIDQAIASGARVINISVSNTVPAEKQVIDAVARAAAAGLVVVLSAGNGGAGGTGASPDEPMPFAQSLADAGQGNVIIVGSVGAQGSISGFSNRAGSYQDSYITALGENLCCVYHDGELYTNSQGSRETISGTSFSAPQVAGAVALLASAFPHLTGREIVEILLDSAFDVGAPGTDSTYGTGILDIAAAFAPKGATSIPGATTSIGLSDSFGIGSAAMGDALVGQSLHTIVIDRYRRAYEVSFGGTAASGESRPRLAPALGTNMRSLAFGTAGMAMAFTIDASNENVAPIVGELRLTHEEAHSARVLAGRIVLDMAPELKVAIGVADSGRALAAGLESRDRPAFLIASSPTTASGAIFATDFSVALRRRWGAWGIGVHAEAGETVRPGHPRLPGYPVLEASDQVTSSIGLTIDRDFGAIDYSLGVAWLREKRTILGARLHDAFGRGGANTIFVDADAGLNFARDWRLGGAMRVGRTMPSSVGLVTDFSHLVSSSWSIDLRRQSIFFDRDRLSMRIAQPLRVEAGGLALKLPVHYSYESFEPIMDVRTLSLTPSGREVIGEIAWQGPWSGGFGAASLFYRRQPDHIAARPDDIGLAIRWRRAW